MQSFAARSILCLLLVACGDDSSAADTGASDTGADTRLVDAPADVAEDVAADVSVDAPTDAPTTDAPDDASSDTDVMDAPVDVPTADSGAPIPVQCRENADCSGPTASCNRNPPGGICLGCADGTCPSGTTCSMFGACTRDCDMDEDCAPGFRCLGSNRCGLIDCDVDSCPDPYVCVSGQCNRPSCADGPCPTGWSCVANLCLEP